MIVIQKVAYSIDTVARNIFSLLAVPGVDLLAYIGIGINSAIFMLPSS